MSDSFTEASIARMERQIETYHNTGEFSTMAENEITLESLKAGQDAQQSQIDLLREENSAIKAKLAEGGGAGGDNMRTYPVGIVSGAWQDKVSKAGKSYTQFVAQLSNGKETRTFSKELATIIQSKIGQTVSMTDQKKGEYWDLFSVM